jgi:signal transduction histidine kinase/CheY-like chemotaxis protein
VLRTGQGLLTYLDAGISAERPLLRLAYAVPYELLAKDFATTRRALLLMMLLSGAAVLVLAYVVSRTISRPVAKLADAAARLARGDLSARVDTSTGGELQVLVSSFNRMADNMRLAQDNRGAAMDLLRRTANLLKRDAAPGVGNVQDGVDDGGDEQRDLIRISDLIRDLIAERERHLAQLKASADAADAANRAKSDFLANMSHEIRTPMNGIIGMADLALEADDEAERLDYLRIVKSSAESLLGIINDILDFSKIEAGKLDVEQVAFHLPQTVQGVLETLGVRAREKGLRIVADLPAQIPRQVVGDPTRLRQVLLNLVGNAIKFTESGEVRVGVRLDNGSDSSARLEFSVCDTGIGIPADKLDSIFEAFSQADTSTTRKYGGTGLGLSITSRLVELMGGVLKVESRPDEGSTFCFTLPMGTATALQERPAPVPEAVGTGQGSLTVLLVEDNPVNQQLAIRLIEKWGHHIVLATNGREAVDMIAAGARFDVILMDMQMPVLGGVAATREIRALEAASGASPHRIVAMTANAMQSDREACLAAGMDDYLAKPIQKDELAGRLRMAGPAPVGTDATIYAGAATGSDAAEIFDYETALGHQDMEIIEIMAPAFLQHAQGELDALAAALTMGDAGEVMRRAHGLKGSLASFGARPAQRLAEEMEQRARCGDLVAIPGLLRQLVAATAALRQALIALAARA